MTLFTIGFTRKSAEQFFGVLVCAGVRRVIDVRLKNASQLAGFAKQKDLAFFLDRIGGIQYEHRPSWAPTKEILDAYKKKRIGWDEYEGAFLALLQERPMDTEVSPSLLDHACLLCSEPNADRCHRRLVAEYLVRRFPELTICHL
jgi:uncharacterized protein (DUF488 family)